MIIKRIKYSIVLLIIFFSWVNLACASDVIINEFVSNPDSGSEWIELLNTTNIDIPLDGWSITDLASPGGTNQHEVLNKELDKLIIQANRTIAIDVANLNNDGDSISLKNGSVLIDQVTYGSIIKDRSSNLSAPSKGKSGALISGSWVTNQEPTKNSANSNTNSSDNSSSSTTTAETTDIVSVTKDEPKVYKISTKIIAPKIVTAGVPFSIDHSTTGLSKEKVIFGKFIWNFGDGMKKEGSTSDPFEYIYEYPGEYVLTLSYSDSSFDTKPDAVDRLTIKVIPSGVSISSVGTYADPFVEIENNSSYEMSLNKWILKGSVHSFLIPEGMVILPNKKLKLSPKITGFDFNDLSSISIIDQTGQTFATYPKQKIYSSSNSQGNIVKADIVKSDQVAGIANSPDVINLNDLGANAGSSGNGLNNKTLIYLGLAGIIIIGIVSVVLIRRKVEYPDYMEKELSAKDMTIIE